MKLELLKQYKLTSEGMKKFYQGELNIKAVICTQIAISKIEYDKMLNGNMRWGYNRDKNTFTILSIPKDDVNYVSTHHIEISNEELELYVDDSDCSNTLNLYEVDYSPFTKENSINKLLIEENAFLRKIVDNFSKK